jgi:hypothetical protein
MKPKPPPPPQPARMGPPPRYTVLLGSDLEQLVAQAEELIDRGMIPAGGVVITTKGQEISYAQSLYRQAMKYVEKFE